MYQIKRLLTILLQLRAFWYTVTAPAENEETQKRGMVLVSYNIGITNPDRSGVFKIASIFNALPVKVAGIHVCVDDPKTVIVAKLASMLVGSYGALRFRCHYGTLSLLASTGFS
jgi:hypothetical protein